MRSWLHSRALWLNWSGYVVGFLLVMPPARAIASTFSKDTTISPSQLVIPDKKVQAARLLEAAKRQERSRQYQTALRTYQQVLALQESLQDQTGISATWNAIARMYYRLGQYEQAIKGYQTRLSLCQKLGDRLEEVNTLNYLGLTYDKLSQYAKALDVFRQAVAISSQTKNDSGLSDALNHMGSIYYNLGQYSQALQVLQQALGVRRKLGNDKNTAATLNTLGVVHIDLGEYPQALELLQESLKMRQKIADLLGQGRTLHNLGYLHSVQGKYKIALQFYQQAIEKYKDAKDQSGEGKALTDLGDTYQRSQQYPKAIAALQQALKITQEIGDRRFEARTLNNLGETYQKLRQYAQASDYYYQSLIISQEVGDRTSERITLRNIADLMVQLKRTDLAILFYKQAVNVTEAIRRDLKPLSPQQQRSYTSTVANTYRRLADLLLQQNRVLEAQQVLDLLKVQELDDYLHTVRGNAKTAQGVELTPGERQVLRQQRDIQKRAITLGKELTQLRRQDPNKLTAAEQQRLKELVDLQSDIIDEFNQFINQPEIEKLSDRLSPTARDQVLSLRRLKNIQDNLAKLKRNAVLLYPLILENRLELILTTQDIPPIRRTVRVSRQELIQTIREFREALQDPNADATIPARKLYNWLIKPIAADLEQADAKLIIYAPDDQLRYIPLAALYDGKQWLVERFQINLITADSLMDLNTQPRNAPRTLAAGFTQGSYRFQVGEQSFELNGLTFAAAEVENLGKLFPNTYKLLNQEFSRNATIPQLDSFNIIHFATHAALVVGKPEDSFILFGNGDRITIRDVEKWRLTNVDLAVLSACQTGLGGKFGNGEEILGFGYLMQAAGAKAALSSLWSVDDGGTQILMNAFYQALKQGNLSKAAALQQAQIAMIRGEVTQPGLPRGSFRLEPLLTAQAPLMTRKSRHPYYWAPFILIGNGL